MQRKETYEQASIHLTMAIRILADLGTKRHLENAEKAFERLEVAGNVADSLRVNTVGSEEENRPSRG